MTATAPRSRIQRKNREAILEAALDVFSQFGFRGATLDQIAEAAGLSKPNLLYYFPSKEAIHATLLETLLDTWLQPLRDLNPDGEPMAELLTYVRRKLDMSRDLPRDPPQHLIFSIWALTQHYADFDSQVRAVLGPGHDPFAEAEGFLDTLFRRLLAPGG